MQVYGPGGQCQVSCPRKWLVTQGRARSGRRAYHPPASEIPAGEEDEQPERGDVDDPDDDRPPSLARGRQGHEAGPPDGDDDRAQAAAPPEEIENVEPRRPLPVAEQQPAPDREEHEERRDA